MRVSVVIPTYNRPERLQKALQHLQAQDYRDWEAWVVDDGDGCGAALAQAYGDARIRGLMNPGKGQVDARNAAITLATGELVAWLDDDDWWHDAHHLQRVVRTMQACEVTLLYRHGWIVVEEGGLERHRIPFALTADSHSIERDNTLLTSSIVYPTRLHRQLGLLDREVDGYFDWDWYIRVVRAGYSLTCLASPGVCYAHHGNNGSKHVHSERRHRNFSRFCHKHQLALTIKNHAMVLQEETDAANNLSTMRLDVEQIATLEDLSASSS